MAKYYGTRAKWFLFIGALTVLSISGLFTARRMLEIRRDAACAARLAHISMALQSYHQEYGSFPPPYIAGKSGRPIHSWRVLLLPFLGYEELYERYDFGEPWDGPHNRLLSEEVCEIYGSATDPQGKGTFTTFLAVVGPKTGWPPGGSTQRDDFGDGLLDTIMVLDWPGSGVKWTEPLDLPYSEALASDNGGKTVRMARIQPQGIRCIDAAGNVRTLPKDVSPDLLKRLLTINGGERVDYDEWN